MAQDYGTAAWSWDTTGLAAGTYEVGVWARQQGSASPYEAYGYATFALGTGSCTSAGLGSNLAPPQTPGTSSITFAATSNSCNAPQYEYWLQTPAGAWSVKRGFGAASWTWNTRGYAVGTYQVGVWVRQAGSTAAHDAYYIGTYQLAVANCTSASIAAAPGSPQAPGTPLALTAGATACGAPSYEFWLLAPSATTWSIVQPYGTGTSFAWSTAGLAKGVYRIGVWARQAGSAKSNDAYAITTFWLGS
jgi:hypothetical protein